MDFSSYFLFSSRLRPFSFVMVVITELWNRVKWSLFLQGETAFAVIYLPEPLPSGQSQRASQHPQCWRLSSVHRTR